MQRDPQRGGWIQTHTGRRFHPLDPRPEDFDLRDIAQGLAHLCRFGGQCRAFYSVAQHSVLVSEICEAARGQREDAIAGLLHDAPEAYIADLPRPVKQEIPEYRAIEDRLWSAVQTRFGLCDPATGDPRFDDALLWQSDDRALMTERRDLMAVDMDWGFGADLAPVRATVTPLGPEEARSLFLERTAALGVE